MSIVLWHLALVGPYPVRTVYTKSRLSRKQVVSRNTVFLDGLPTYLYLYLANDIQTTQLTDTGHDKIWPRPSLHANSWCIVVSRRNQLSRRKIFIIP